MDKIVLITTKHKRLKELVLIKEIRDDKQVWYKVPEACASIDINLVINELKEQISNLKESKNKSEKDIYEQLLTNRENPKMWDLLTWGNDDWYGNHPWTTFFAYRTTSEWSSIEKDDILQNEIEAFFSYPFQSGHFQQSVDKIVHHVYDNAYMLFIPSPNIVLAINKEVSYVPSSVAIMPLWEAKISKNHWSVRKGSYAPEKLLPMKPLKVIK